MKKKLSAFKLGSLPSLVGTFFIILIIGVYFYSRLSTSSLELEIVTLAETVEVGESFDIKLSISNNFKEVLKDIDLSVDLPDDAILSSGQGGLRRFSIGDIGPGGGHEEIVRVVALPSESDKRDINFSISYSIGGLTAQFEKNESISVKVDELPIEMAAIAPKEIVANEEFEIGAEYSYTGSDTLKDLKFKLDYPEVFSVKSSKFKPEDQANKSWLIGDLENGDVGAISLSGSVDLPEGSEITVTAGFYIEIFGEDYPLFTEDLKMKILPSPLSLVVALNDAEAPVISPGEVLNYKLRYRNSSSEQFNNLVIRTKLVGQMYDLSTLQSDGALWNSLTKTITWDYQRLPKLKSLAMGEEGEVSFSIKLLNDYPIRRLNDKNFTARVESRIEAVGQSGAKKATSVVAESKVAGRIAVFAKALFRDAESLILNTGSLPPRVGSQTDFTVHWALTNYSNDASQIEVRAALGPDVVFTGITKGSGQIPIYDPKTDEVVWKVDKAFATTGITGAPLETVFQIRVKPRAEYLGNYMPILGETRLVAKDDFTGLSMSASQGVLTTRLEGDPTVSENDGKIIQ